MIDVVILCPVEVEFKIIQRILENPTSKQIQKVCFDYGRMKTPSYSWTIAVIEPDLNVNSFGVKVAEVINALRPKYVFLAGIAGGIKDAKIGDIVIGTKSYLYEGGKETPEGFVSRPRVVENQSFELLTLAKRLSREIKIIGGRFHFGAIASGNKVLANKDSRSVEIIKKHYNDTQAIEMEAYEFSLVASRCNVPYLNIRGISDLIDGKAQSDSEGHQEIASKKVAKFLSQFIPHLPVPHQKIYYSEIVNYTDQRFTFLQKRNLKKVILNIKDTFIEIEEKETKVRIENLESVEYIKMGGDVKPNWVRITYLEDDQIEEKFYSEKQFLEYGNWVGGSKKLFAHFEDFKKRQLSV